MVLKTKKNKGYTLIEVMGVVIITSFLAVSTVGFGKNWIDSINVRNATTALDSAMKKAKNLALQNKNSKSIPATVVFTEEAICIREDEGKVKKCENGFLWKGDIKAKITIGTKEINDCINFDNTGLITTVSYCKTNSLSTFNIQKGKKIVQVKL